MIDRVDTEPIESDDDEEDYLAEPLAWSPRDFDARAEPCRTLLVFENDAAVSFGRRCLVSEGSLLARLNGADVSLHRGGAPGVVLCLARVAYLGLYSSVVQLLYPLLSTAESVHCVQTLSRAKHRSREPGDAIRSLGARDSRYAPLETPHLVSGVSAGALNLREALGRPCSIEVHYLEGDPTSGDLDRAQADRLEEFAKKRGAKVERKYTPKPAQSSLFA